MECTYSTKNEIDFIKILGTGQLRQCKFSRKKMLELYVQAAKKRARWVWIDRAEVIYFAESLIHSL